MLKAIFITSFFGLLIFCQAAFGQAQQQDANVKSSPSSPPQRQESADKYPALTKQADEMVKAAVKNDFAKFAGYLHPKVIEKAGGKEKFVAALKQITREMEAAGVSLVAYSVEKPAQVIEVDKLIFAVMPTRASVKTPEGVQVENGNLLAVSADNGSSWKFVRVDNKESIKSIFPDIADKLEIFKAANSRIEKRAEPNREDFAAARR
ncbi:MAG TPA: hypothetical protein VK400_11440 [Pyrinomonadaceae bacterium]|nr:hypothetical protein [Pyrinomonadaceae bacterium]